jgi:hypothetical protein
VRRSDDPERLSLHACRSLIGSAGSCVPDAELEPLRDHFYDLALCVVTAFEEDSDTRQSFEALSRLAGDERIEVEERAAIMQFDASMLPEAALRAALTARGPSRPGEDQRERKGRDLLPRIDKGAGPQPVAPDTASPVSRVLQTRRFARPYRTRQYDDTPKMMVILQKAKRAFGVGTLHDMTVWTRSESRREPAAFASPGT